MISAAADVEVDVPYALARSVTYPGGIRPSVPISAVSARLAQFDHGSDRHPSGLWSLIVLAGVVFGCSTSPDCLIHRAIAGGAELDLARSCGHASLALVQRGGPAATLVASGRLIFGTLRATAFYGGSRLM